MSMKNYKFWFVTGSQALYGQEVVDEVNRHSKIIADAFDKCKEVVGGVVFKQAVLENDAIVAVMQAANNDPECVGVITWMHTFSPSKMWIAGFKALQKPLLHLNTQFNAAIPWNEIDMDFMNLNQSAHGDREHGFIVSRLRKQRKVVAGHWEDTLTRERIGDWMRAAIGVYESAKLKIARFGDNMREVAVTEGDKVEAQIRLGWSINGWGVGDLIAMVNDVTEAQIDEKMTEYTEKYDIKTDDVAAVKYQAKMEVALEKFLVDGGFGGYTDCFQDLQQLEQLPGLATQNLMSKGFGFGAEGDWKDAALVRTMKLMAKGLPGGTSFMEDYTYHFEPGNDGVLGAHMLEVDPDIAVTRPTIEVHALGIGDRNPPARLCFKTGDGDAILATLVDMGGRLRMIVNDVKACAPFNEMPKLPVAQVMWRPLPSMSGAAEAWITAGGAHHCVLSYQLNAGHMRDFCDILGIEFIHIGAHTDTNQLNFELKVNDLVFKFR